MACSQTLERQLLNMSKLCKYPITSFSVISKVLKKKKYKRICLFKDFFIFHFSHLSFTDILRKGAHVSHFHATVYYFFINSQFLFCTGETIPGWPVIHIKQEREEKTEEKLPCQHLKWNGCVIYYLERPTESRRAVLCVVIDCEL